MKHLSCVFHHFQVLTFGDLFETVFVCFFDFLAMREGIAEVGNLLLLPTIAFSNCRCRLLTHMNKLHCETYVDCPSSVSLVCLASSPWPPTVKSFDSRIPLLAGRPTTPAWAANLLATKLSSIVSLLFFTRVDRVSMRLGIWGGPQQLDSSSSLLGLPLMPSRRVEEPIVQDLRAGLFHSGPRFQISFLCVFWIVKRFWSYFAFCSLRWFSFRLPHLD